MLFMCIPFSDGPIECADYVLTLRSMAMGNAHGIGTLAHGWQG
jgi:hypothetical protein